MAEAGGPLEQVGHLVEERHVGAGPPRGALGAGRGAPQQHPLLVLGEDAGGRLGEGIGIREEPEDDGGGVEDRPEAADARGDGRRARDRVLHPVVGGVTGALHLQQHAVGEALG